VLDFIKKDMNLQDDQFIDVQLEDPPKPTANSNNTNSKKEEYHDDFDDVMFDMTAPSTGKTNNKGKNPP
jgi:hypothetical protein